MAITKVNITTDGAKGLTCPLQVENLIMGQLMTFVGEVAESNAVLSTERQDKYEVIKIACNAD